MDGIACVSSNTAALASDMPAALCIPTATTCDRNSVPPTAHPDESNKQVSSFAPSAQAPTHNTAARKSDRACWTS
eukprot:12947520-Alexandrium_andersonii.AAC.1